MENRTNRKQFIIYLIAAFVPAWIVQIIASQFALKGDVAMFRIIMAACMFIPFLAVIIARIPLKGMGWIPHLKGRLKWVFFAMWMPLVFNLAGAALYFLIFPGHFDAEFETMKLTLGEAGLAQLEAQGMTLELYIISTCISALTIGPFYNMIFAIGEEAGWRGGMYPYLKERFGKTKGRVIGGIIWGAWHWPVMILAGYEYGLNYFGAPFPGLVVFCLSTVFMGILEDILYENTGTIWGAALLHGAINCWQLFAYLLKPEYTDRMIFGPSIVGIIAMIPMAVLAIVMMMKKKETGSAQE